MLLCLTVSEVKVKVTQSSDSLRPHRLYSPWNSPGQNNGVDSLSLQQIFPTQCLNPGLPSCRRILYQLSHKGSSRILEWVAYPFSRGFSRPRSQTRVFCTAGGFFTNWAMREASIILSFFKSTLLSFDWYIKSYTCLMHAAWAWR